MERDIIRPVLSRVRACARACMCACLHVCMRVEADDPTAYWQWLMQESSSSEQHVQFLQKKVPLWVQQQLVPDSQVFFLRTPQAGPGGGAGGGLGGTFFVAVG